MDGQMIKRKIFGWIKENQLVFIYMVLAIFLEATAVLAGEGNPFLSRPFVSLGLLIFMCGISLRFYRIEKMKYIRMVRRTPNRIDI